VTGTSFNKKIRGELFITGIFLYVTWYVSELFCLKTLNRICPLGLFTAIVSAAIAGTVVKIKTGRQQSSNPFFISYLQLV
jgi:hypothetical protein